MFLITFLIFYLFIAEEVITKKKTELTTTKQIETRVKRQVVLEDGKVVQDSGPIVETNTTQDTDTQESETVEVSPSSIFNRQSYFYVFRFSVEMLAPTKLMDRKRLKVVA